MNTHVHIIIYFFLGYGVNGQQNFPPVFEMPLDRLDDCYAQGTNACMSDRKPKTVTVKAARCWNEDCRKAAEEMRNAPLEDKPKLINRLHRVIKKAKQEWANALLETAPGRLIGRQT